MIETKQTIENIEAIESIEAMQAEIKALKRDNLFLSLRVKETKKRHRALRLKYEDLKLRCFKEIPRVSMEEAAERQMRSTSRYASENGLNPAKVFAALEKEGIVERTLCGIILSNPAEHAAHAAIVQFQRGPLKRELLYWTAEGMRFLDEVMLANGLRPMPRANR